MFCAGEKQNSKSRAEQNIVHFMLFMLGWTKFAKPAQTTLTAWPITNQSGELGKTSSMYSYTYTFTRTNYINFKFYSFVIQLHPINYFSVKLFPIFLQFILTDAPSGEFQY